MCSSRELEPGAQQEAEVRRIQRGEGITEKGREGGGDRIIML